MGPIVAANIKVVRLYLSEAEKGSHETLVDEILNMLRNQHKVRNVIVSRGIAGEVDSKDVYSDDIIRILVNLPLVIEFSDEPDVIDAVLHLLEGKLGAGRTLLWKAHSH